MAWDPGAVKKPLTTKSNLSIIGPRVYVVHITATRSSNDAYWRWYNGGPRPYPHFMTPRAGQRWQIKDTKYQAPAQLFLNPYALSNETEGLASDPFTDSQAEQVAQSLAWSHKTHGIPLELTPDSRTDRRGVLTHRWGCKGNFPSTGLLRGLTQRGAGVLMSTSTGKICPTDSRILQMPEILRRAKQIVAGGVATPLEEDDMFCQLGNKGPKVRVLQLRLRELGFYKGEIDADYGPLTSKAVLAMRKAAGSSAASGDAFDDWAYWQLQRQLLAKLAGKPGKDGKDGAPGLQGPPGEPGADGELTVPTDFIETATEAALAEASRRLSSG